MSLAYSGVEPQPSLAWQFESSNVDYVTNLQPSAQVSPGPAQLVGSAALVTNAPTSNTAVYFPGTTSTWMNLGTSTPVNFNTSLSNIFMECWVYSSRSYNPNFITWHQGAAGGQENWSMYFGTNGSLTTSIWGDVAGTATQGGTGVGSAIALNTWTHVGFAIANTASVYKTYIYVNGTPTAYTPPAGWVPKFYAAGTTQIGGRNYSPDLTNMYIRDLRVVQGGIVPTTSFTPGSAPFSYTLPSYVTGSGSVVFTLLGQFVTYPTGKYNKSIYFDNRAATSTGLANCYSSFSVSSAGLTSNSLTASIWIKPYYAFPVAGINQNFLFLTDTQTTYQLGINSGINQSQMFSYISSSPSVTLTNGTNLTSQVWNHFTTVFSNVNQTASNTSVSYYFNGTQVGSTSNVARTGISVLSFVNLCATGGGYNGGWGELDDLRIYNTALTSTQVQSVYSSQGAPAPGPVMPQPRLAWAFDGTTAPYIGSATGTTTGSVSYSTGKYIQAVNITNNPVGSPNAGANYITWTNYGTFNPSVGVTACFWINVNALPASGQQSIPLWMRGSAVNSAVYITLTPTYWGAAYTDGTNYYVPISSAPLSTGVWYHLTVVVGAGTVAGYQNGVQISNPVAFSNPLDVSGFLYLGGNGNYGPASAIYDDLRIFDRALTSAQVQAIYNQQGVPGRGVVNGLTPNITQTPVATIYGNQITPADTSPSKPTTSVVGQTTYSNTVPQYTQFGSGLALTPATTGLTISIVFTFNNGVFTTENLFYFGGNGNYKISVRLANYDALAFQFWDSVDSRFSSYNPPFTPIASWSNGVKYYFTFTITPVSTTTINFSFYVNGVLNGSGSGTSSATALGNGTYTTATIGANNNGAYANMTVYDFVVLNTVLSASQVSILYQKQLANSNYQIAPPAALTGTPLFTQLSTSATSSAVGAFSLRAVNGTTVKAVAVQAHPVVQWPPVSMTSNTTVVSGQLYGNGTYVATASVPNSTIWYIFDNNISTYYEQATAFPYNYATGAYIGSNATTISSVSVLGEWFQVQLPTSIILRSYTLVGRQTVYWRLRNPTTFWIAGSNDGTTWSNVHQQSNINPPQEGITINVPTTSNSVPYTYYRLVVNVIGNSDYIGDQRNLVNLASWNLYGVSPSYAPNAAQDFYADRLGNLLTAPVTGRTLANWLGTATGYVTTWYDQSGRGNHATQATAANQPIIQRATKGPGYACVYTGNQWVSFGTLNTFTGTPFCISAVTTRTSNVSLNGITGWGDGFSGFNFAIFTFSATQDRFRSDFRKTTGLNVSGGIPVYTPSEGVLYPVCDYSSGFINRLYNKSSLIGTSGNGVDFLNTANTNTPSIGLAPASAPQCFYLGEIYEVIFFTKSLYDIDGTSTITQIYNNQLSAYGT
jgi:hypothetical protein